jgi:small subunit ribosomal protein S17
MKASVGYNIDYKPENVCDDVNCPYHGNLSVRGKIFEGKVTSDARLRTVKVEWDVEVKDKKYSRYFKTKSSVSAHNPDCIGAKVGDKVLIGETRPLSKTKHFTVLRVIE